MAKIAGFALGLALVVLAQALPSPQQNPLQSDPLFKAAQEGNWEEVQRLLREQTALSLPPLNHEVLEADVKNLRPTNGGKVFGESNYSFHSSSNVNGQTSESSGGHRVVNNNGKVDEYDTEPRLPH